MRGLLVLALIGAAMAAPKNVQRIVGGEAATIEQYKFIAGMMFSGSGITWYQTCGGTIITPTAVVSAAHCYAGHFSGQWRARVGTRFTDGGTIIGVAWFNFHEKYNGRLMLNDIIIVRLAQAITFSSTVGIARIAGPNYSLPDNTSVFVAGWGEFAFEGEWAEELQHVELKTINRDVCAARYVYLNNQPDEYNHWPAINQDMICLGILDVGDKDFCDGDSGGPVVHQGDVLVAIPSYGYSCGHHYYPRVSVRVSSYTDWISRNAVI